MTLFDITRLSTYWRKYPPLRDLVAAYMGFKPADDEPEKKYATAEDMRRVMKMTGGKVPGVGPNMGR